MPKRAKKPTNFASLDPGFIMLFGEFFHLWSGIEERVDIAIGIFLKIPDKETHLVTASMEFSRKATLLRGLIIRSNHKNKERLIRSLNIFQNESKRNILAHSYIGDTDDYKKAVFLERSTHGKLTIREHEYDFDEFSQHLSKIHDAFLVFDSALGLTTRRLQRFLNAALSFKANHRCHPPRRATSR